MDGVEKFAMENCLMLIKAAAAASTASGVTPGVAGRKYTCKDKTCGREFDSFQALGGHRASHKKVKLVKSEGEGEGDVACPTPAKQKTHACSLCGAEFPIGQALGGHMRRHRQPVAVSGDGNSTITNEVSLENSEGNDNDVNNKRKKDEDGLGEEVEHVEKRLRVEEVCLDLNLGFLPWVKKEEGEIVEQEIVEDEDDFLKLQLGSSIRV